MHRLIFCINSGRSGSEYLYRILDTAQNVRAFHEPEPDMAGRILPRYPASRPSLLDRLAYVPVYVRKYQKIRAIRRIIDELPTGHIYAETNHMFILAFHDVVVNHLKNVDVILLRRYLPAVVKSFVELDHFTPQCRLTRFWFTSPNSPSAVAPALAPDGDLDQIDRIIGYLVDVEARARRFIARHPNTRVVSVRLAELNHLKVRALFATLGLEEGPDMAKLVGGVVNSKPGHKRKVGKSVSIDYCHKRIQQYLAKCARQGLELPDLPHIEAWRLAS